MNLAKQPTAPKLGIVDRVVGFFSPERAYRRSIFRNALSTYRTGVRTRLDRGWPTDGTNTRDFHNRTHSASGMGKDVYARARDLDANNAVAAGLLDRAVDNVIGCGFSLNATTRDNAWNRTAERLWSDWAEAGADVRGLGTLTDVLALSFRSYLRDGDTGIILLGNGSLQPVESDDIVSPIKRSGDANVIDGVEVDRLGKPVRFHVATDSNGVRTEAVNARDFIYLARRKSHRDTRGESAFAQNAAYFDQIDGNIEAVVAAAQMAAMFGLVIESLDPGSELAALGQTTTTAAGGTGKKFNLEPGMIKYLSRGETVRQVSPQHPAQNFVDFLRFVLRICGLPFGIPLELILLDFSQTNYSSARASLLQAHRTFRCHQQRIGGMLRRIYRWRISKWIKEGQLSARDDAWQHTWTAPGWAWIDPTKEVTAALMAVDSGIDTLTDVAAGMGRDFSEIVAKRQREIAMMTEAGIPILHSTSTREPKQEVEQGINAERIDADQD